MHFKPNTLSPPFVRIDDECAVWYVRPEFEGGVRRVGPEYFNLSRQPNAIRIKSGDQRAVWRVRDEQLGAVYVKSFDSPGRLGRVWTRVFGSPANREAAALNEAERRGIQAVRVMAVGLRHGCRGSVLITREARNASPLPECWANASSHAEGTGMRQQRGALLRCAAALLAESHLKGLAHLDGHPGNILVAWGEDAAPVACYVDLARCAWSRGETPPQRRIDAMAQLYQFAFDKTTRTDRMRFLRRYVAVSRPDGAAKEALHRPTRRLVRSIELARFRQAKRLARHRDRRIRRDGKYFHGIELAGGWRGVVATRLERRHRFGDVGVFDRTTQMWQEELEPLLAIGARAGESNGGDSGGAFRVGLVTARGLAQAFVWTVGRSPARDRFEQCHRRRHRDEPVPLILGYLEKRRGGLVREAMTIEARVQANIAQGHTVG